MATKQLLRKPRPPKIEKVGCFCLTVSETTNLHVDSASSFAHPITPPSSASNLLLEHDKRNKSNPSSKLSSLGITNNDKRYVLDHQSSRCTTRQNGVHKQLIKHIGPRGPGLLPKRNIKKQYPYLMEFLKSDEDIRYSKPPLFTLNDFVLQISQDFNISLHKVKEVVFSSANYSKITQMIAEQLQQKCNEISFVDVDLDALENIEDMPSRVPQHQVLYEMAAMIKERVKEALQVEVECKIKKLPKFTPTYKLGEAPHSEIIVLEKGKNMELDRVGLAYDNLTYPANDTLLPSSKRHFQDSVRGSSPFSTINRVEPYPTMVPLESYQQSNDPNLNIDTLRQCIQDSISATHLPKTRNVSATTASQIDAQRSVSASYSHRSLNQQSSRTCNSAITTDRYSSLTVLSNVEYSVNDTIVSSYVESNSCCSSVSDNDSNQISPSEIAILDCMMSGGIALSLKANFLQQIPDIAPIRHTLTYLNLSYNCLKEVPPEVFLLRNLQILKLRNNPISLLPTYIDQLTFLESLVVSFCLITTLPISLFNISNLRIMDVSYNKISFIPKEINKLKKLQYLNVEGNELNSLPYTLLNMNLRKIKVKNNFMHPLLWEENSSNQPQLLSDLAALAFYHHGLNRHYALHPHQQTENFKSNHIPKEMAHILTKCVTWCECCGGPHFGKGLRLIRPAKRLFNVRYLPLLFHACSPHCRSKFLNNDAEIVPQLYMNNTDTYESISIS